MKTCRSYCNFRSLTISTLSQVRLAKMSQSTGIFWVGSQVSRLKSTLYYRVVRLKLDDSIVNGVSRSDLSRLTWVGLPTLMGTLWTVCTVLWILLLHVGILRRPEPRPDVHAEDRRGQLRARGLQGGRPPDPRRRKGGAQSCQEGIRRLLWWCQTISNVLDFS